MLAGLIDLLAGNPPVITRLSNHLFSSSAIFQAVHDDVINALSSPADRASKLMNSLLANIKGHPYPSSIMSSLITSLQNVDLIFMANKLKQELKFSK